MEDQYGRKHHEIQGEVYILVERNLWESNAFGYFGHMGNEGLTAAELFYSLAA